MQIVTRLLNHFDGETENITMASNGRIANKLKTTKNNFKSFAEAPFQKAEVIVYQTAEDLLE